MASAANNQNDTSSRQTGTIKLREIKSIQEELENKHVASRIEEFRLNLKWFLNHTHIGVAYQNVMLVISVLSGFQFMAQTYILAGSPEARVFDFIERVLSSLFMFDWVLSFFVAELKLKHILR